VPGVSRGRCALGWGRRARGAPPSAISRRAWAGGLLRSAGEAPATGLPPAPASDDFPGDESRAPCDAVDDSELQQNKALRVLLAALPGALAALRALGRGSPGGGGGEGTPQGRKRGRGGESGSANGRRTSARVSGRAARAGGTGAGAAPPAGAGVMTVSDSDSDVGPADSGDGAPPPPGCVACPVCRMSVKEDLINVHVDVCLARGGGAAAAPAPGPPAGGPSALAALGRRGPGPPPGDARAPPPLKPVPRRAFALDKEPTLRRAMREYGLSVEGRKEALVARYREFTLRVQLAIDEGRRTTYEAIARELARDESRGSLSGGRAANPVVDRMREGGGARGAGAGAGAGGAGGAWARLVREVLGREPGRRERMAGRLRALRGALRGAGPGGGAGDAGGGGAGPAGGGCGGGPGGGEGGGVAELPGA